MQIGQKIQSHLVIDDEGQIQIIGALRNQMHALTAELGPDVGELVEHRTHAAADQGDRAAGRDDLDPADIGQVRAERVQDRGVLLSGGPRELTTS